MTAPGPVSSKGSYHAMYMCVLPESHQFIRDTSFPLIDEKSCDIHGKQLDVSSVEKLRLYPLDAVVFYTQIPYTKTHVMSRMFQFLLTDMGLKFTTSDYPTLIASELWKMAGRGRRDWGGGGGGRIEFPHL